VALEKRRIDVVKGTSVSQLVRWFAMGAVDDPRYELLRRHAELDGYLKTSVVLHAVLRPATFFSNLLVSAPAIVASDRWYGSAPNGRNAAVNARDIGDVAAAIVTKPALQNQVHLLSDPEALSYTWYVVRLSAILGRSIRYMAMEGVTLLEVRAKRGLPG